MRSLLILFSFLVLAGCGNKTEADSQAMAPVERAGSAASATGTRRQPKPLPGLRPHH